jgi:RNA polymerase sigma-70 factor (ECF subfamily)
MGSIKEQYAEKPAVPGASCVRADEMNRTGSQDLVNRAREGDTTAFDRLVTEYQNKVYRLARRMTETQEDAEDVLQEAFIRAYRSLGSFNGRAKFSTWLYRITVNLALMKLRKRKLKTVSIDAPVEAGDGVVYREIRDGGSDPLEKLIACESGEVLTRAISELSAEHRALFILRDVEKLSTEETARVLGLTVPAVKSRLHRTRLALRESLLRAAGGAYAPGRPCPAFS